MPLQSLWPLRWILNRTDDGEKGIEISEKPIFILITPHFYKDREFQYLSHFNRVDNIGLNIKALQTNEKCNFKGTMGYQNIS